MLNKFLLRIDMNFDQSVITFSTFVELGSPTTGIQPCSPGRLWFCFIRKVQMEFIHTGSPILISCGRLVTTCDIFIGNIAFLTFARNCFDLLDRFFFLSLSLVSGGNLVV